MIKLNVYTTKGTKKQTGMNLPRDDDEKENLNLLAQAVRVYENRVHAQNAKTKTRGEVQASKRKIYAQKGTGRARHGALSAPIFVGGGRAHGPDGRSRSLRLPKKMAQKAFSIALLLKAKNNSLFVIEDLNSLKKTKDAAELINKLLESVKKDQANNIVVALSRANIKTMTYFRNIKRVTVERFCDLNAYKVFRSTILIADKDAFSEQKRITDTKKKDDIKKVAAGKSKK